MRFECCVPCLFGLEGPVGNELRKLGMEDVRPENGRVRFTGDANDVAKANICLKFGERVLIQLGSFEARSFDELFESVKALPWEEFVPRDGAFPVKGYSLDSALHSVPDCQKIIKKAAAGRLGEKYGLNWCPETGETYQIQFSLMKDRANIYLDTTGVGLHKRGYRPANVAAPLRETLAAAMVDIAGYRGKGEFYDPFCGGGTIAIEAALAARNRAPGLYRQFSAEKWKCIDPAVWKNEREASKARQFHGEYRIFASDIDPAAVDKAKANAKRAGVGDIIEFSVADAREFSPCGGVLVTNPPYGERLLEKRQAEELYRDFGKAVREADDMKMCILSSHTEFERCFGRTADKRRKLYNGMIKCELYIYTQKKQKG